MGYSCEILHHIWAAAVKYYIILELQLWNTTSYLSCSCEILYHIWATAVKYYIILELQLWNTTSYACYSCEILHHTLATAVKYCFTLLDTSAVILLYTAWSTAVKFTHWLPNDESRFIHFLNNDDNWSIYKVQNLISLGNTLNLDEAENSATKFTHIKKTRKETYYKGIQKVGVVHCWKLFFFFSFF